MTKTIVSADPVWWEERWVLSQAAERGFLLYVLANGADNFGMFFSPVRL